MPRRHSSVLMVSTVHQPYDVRIFAKEAKTLARAGFEVSVAMTVERATRIDGIRIIPLGKHGGPKWHRLIRNFRALPLILRHPGIVHVHDPELLVAAAFARICGRRIVYDVHEFYHDKLGASDANAAWIPLGLKPVVALAYAALERLLLPRICGVVVVTQEMIAHYERFVTTERIALVRNLPAISAADLELARSAKRLLEERYFVHTGGASRSRAFHTLVEAAERLREAGCQALIVNLGEVRLSDYGAARAAELTRRAKRAGVRNLGRVPYGEVMRWLAHAELGIVLLQPSANHEKAQPTKLFEYFYHGLPVICTDVGAGAAIVRARRAGVTVANEDAPALARACLEIAGDPQARAAFGAASRRAAEAYSFEDDGARLVSMYRRLTSVARS